MFEYYTKNNNTGLKNLHNHNWYKRWKISAGVKHGTLFGGFMWWNKSFAGLTYKIVLSNQNDLVSTNVTCMFFIFIGFLLFFDDIVYSIIGYIFNQYKFYTPWYL